jgi:hypothetical protein
MAMRDRIPHQVFYDPGRDDQSDNWFKVNDIRQIGYCLTLPANTFYLGTNVNPTIIPQPISRGLNILLPPPNASERALVAGGTWMPAFSSYPNAHVDSKDYPLGDNVAMLDGSAKWRKFKDMIPRQVTDSGVDILGARW